MLGCVAQPLLWIGYVAVGALAAAFMAPRRTTGRGAGQGALAGLMMGAVGGLAEVVLAPLSVKVAGGSQAIISQLPADALQQLQQAGIDPNMLVSGGAMSVYALLCCLPAMLLLGAGLGALGGLIFAAAKPE